jgi:hypothetical protein
LTFFQVFRYLLIRAFFNGGPMEDRSATNPAQDFLDEEFPVAHRHLIPSALRRAYSTASRVVEAEPSLQTLGGRRQRGDLVAHAAEYEVMQLVQTGALPFDASWEPFARPTGYHLVVWTKRGRLTISQVEDWWKKPRGADFRDDYSMSNMAYLFKEMNDAQNRAERKHLLLLHGYQELTFSYLTAPHAKFNYHLAKSANLMLMPHIATPERTKEEGPTDSPDPEALDNLHRIIRDSSSD